MSSQVLSANSDGTAAAALEGGVSANNAYTTVTPNTKRLREEDIIEHDAAMMRMRRLSGGGGGHDNNGLLTHNNTVGGTNGGGVGAADDDTFLPPFAGLRSSLAMKEVSKAVLPFAEDVSPNDADNDDDEVQNDNDDDANAPTNFPSNPNENIGLLYSDNSNNSSGRGGRAVGARRYGYASGGVDYSVRATEGSESTTSRRSEMEHDEAEAAEGREVGTSASTPTTVVVTPTSTLTNLTTANKDDTAPQGGSNGGPAAAPASTISPQSSASKPKPPTSNVHIKSRAGGGVNANSTLPSPASGGSDGKITKASTQQLPLKIFGSAPSSSAHHALAAAGGRANHNGSASHVPPALLHGGSAGGDSKVGAGNLSQHERLTRLFEKALVDIVPLMSPFSPTAPENCTSNGANFNAANQQQQGPPDARSLASEIATTLLASAKDPSARAKTLLFHLKDSSNTELRNSLRKGRLSGAAFVNMDTFNQLFNKSKQAHVSAAREAVDAHHDLRLVSKNDPALSSMYECPQCKQRHHTLVQIQTRSADEPMTEICQCVMCDKVWRAGE